MNLVKINPLEEQVLSLFIRGLDNEAIGLELSIPVQEVKKILRRKQIKNYLKEFAEERAIQLKAKHLDMLNELTDEYLDKAKENGITSVLRHNRDFLDVVEATHKMTAQLERDRLAKQTGDIFMNILHELSGGDTQDTEIITQQLDKPDDK